MNTTLTEPRPSADPATKQVNFTPAAYHSITPYLVLQGAAQALDFYKSVFGACELMRIPGPNGTIVHAEIRIGNSPVMLCDEMPGMGFKSPASFGGTPVGLVVYVPDVDACAALAVAGGARQIKPVENQFYGDRSGTFTDPFGHLWTISTHIEDVSPAELQRRMANLKPCGQT